MGILNLMEGSMYVNTMDVISMDVKTVFHTVERHI